MSSAELEIFALGVGEERERRRPEARGVVDEHVEAAEGAELIWSGDRVDVLLPRDVADDAVGAGMVAGNAVDALAGAGDEGDAGAAAAELAHEREAETGGASGDGDSEMVHAVGCSGMSQILDASSFMTPTLQVKVNLKSSAKCARLIGMD